VTTHLRARVVQAGAFLALVVGGVAVAPVAALAQPPDVQITSLVPTEVPSGGKVTMQYTVANTNNGEGQQRGAAIKVTSRMRCEDGACGQLVQINPGENQNFTATLSAPTVDAGRTQQFQVTVTALINGESSSTSQTVNVKGPDKPQTVRQISGKVKDQDGKAISGATVAMQDSNGNRYQTSSNGSGGYQFTSSDNQPIAPGNISVGAGKNGFNPAAVQVQAAAGRTVNVPLTLKKIAATASASASPSASASATASPTDEVTEEPAAAAPTVPATDDAKTASQNSDSGSLLFIILGGLLVAAGIGAIVLVLMRRRNSGDDDPDDPTGMGGGPGGMVPPSQGRFADATRVAAPMGAGPADATMVAPRSGAPSISDAPTMLQRPVPAVDDEFPDPYGAPIPPQGGYAGAGGWDAEPQYGGAYGGGAYGAPGQYARPAEDPYAAGANDYAAAQDSAGYGGGPAPQQRFDEPTGMYQPGTAPDAGYGGYEAGGGYGAGTPQYGGYDGQHQPEQPGGYDTPGYQAGGYQAGGYGHEPAEQSGYGSWGTAPAGGIEAGSAYGPQSGAQQYGGGDGQPYGGGYGDQGAYADQGGYDQRGGYGGYEQGQPGGYADQDDRGYDQYADKRGAYGDPATRAGGQPRRQPPESAHPGRRRPSEWDG
jgi:hypothetical protein